MNYKKIELTIQKIAYEYINGYQNNQSRFLCKLVDTSFNNLNFVSKQIINNEFFFNDYPYWWEKYYSKRYFLKLKKKAMNQFLFNIYVNHYA
ncbi:MAG: MG284/MPN403 family protein [Bacilli bacterium]